MTYTDRHGQALLLAEKAQRTAIADVISQRWVSGATTIREWDDDAFSLCWFKVAGVADEIAAYKGPRLLVRDKEMARRLLHDLAEFGALQCHRFGKQVFFRFPRRRCDVFAMQVRAEIDRRRS